MTAEANVISMQMRKFCIASATCVCVYVCVCMCTCVCVCVCVCVCQPPVGVCVRASER